MELLEEKTPDLKVCPLKEKEVWQREAFSHHAGQKAHQCIMLGLGNDFVFLLCNTEVF